MTDSSNWFFNIKRENTRMIVLKNEAPCCQMHEIQLYLKKEIQNKKALEIY